MSYKPIPTVLRDAQNEAVVFDAKAIELMHCILMELRINNAYLQEIVGERKTEQDLEEY